MNEKLYLDPSPEQAKFETKFIVSDELWQKIRS